MSALPWIAVVSRPVPAAVDDTPNGFDPEVSIAKCPISSQLC